MSAVRLVYPSRFDDLRAASTGRALAISIRGHRQRLQQSRPRRLRSERILVREKPTKKSTLAIPRRINDRDKMASNSPILSCRKTKVRELVCHLLESHRGRHHSVWAIIFPDSFVKHFILRRLSDSADGAGQLRDAGLAVRASFGSTVAHARDTTLVTFQSSFLLR